MAEDVVMEKKINSTPGQMPKTRIIVNVNSLCKL